MSFWLIVGPVIGALYFGVFYTLIPMLNLETPGRETEEELATMATPSTQGTSRAADILVALGGADNINSLDACITRLRLVVKSTDQVNKEALKRLGSSGVMITGQNVQAIFALVPASGNGCPNPRDADQAQLPVVCVDYCDADAYCRAQNKVLCGGFDGASLASPGARIDPATSIWMAACTDVGRRKYPYTDSKDFTPKECVDQYPSPFVPSAKEAKVTGCASLRDTCCAFRPVGDRRAACQNKVNAGNAAACDAAAPPSARAAPRSVARVSTWSTKARRSPATRRWPRATRTSVRRTSHSWAAAR